MVTWHSYGQDGDGTGVFGQRYDGSGATAGGEFQVNTTTAGNQWYSSAASLSDGGFVTVWECYGQDGSYEAVIGRIYPPSPPTASSPAKSPASPSRHWC